MTPLSYSFKILMAEYKKKRTRIRMVTAGVSI
jgi:hypothetical protein